jgi:hypothetical protein
MRVTSRVVESRLDCVYSLKQRILSHSLLKYTQLTRLSLIPSLTRPSNLSIPLPALHVKTTSDWPTARRGVARRSVDE